LVYDRALDLSSKNTTHVSVLPFVLCVLQLGQKQRKENTDGQDILKLFGFLYVIPERNPERSTNSN
jgi:hypothetical protein